MSAGERGDIDGVKEATKALNEAIAELDSNVVLWGEVKVVRIEIIHEDGATFIEKPNGFEF